MSGSVATAQTVQMSNVCHLENCGVGDQALVPEPADGAERGTLHDAGQHNL